MFSTQTRSSNQFRHVYQNLQETTSRLNQALFNQSTYQRQVNLLQTYTETLDRIETRLRALTLIHQNMTNYRVWLYTKVIIPEIATTINQMVAIVTQSTDFVLEGNVMTKNNRVNLAWTIASPSGIGTTLLKAGGFRRSIFGLVMRIALTHLGFSHFFCTQLFIDEYFVNSDNDNLQKMKDFLVGLVDYFPHGIILSLASRNDPNVCRSSHSDS